MKKNSFYTKFLMVPLLFLLGGSAYSQQEPQYTMYMFNTLSVNPAYAGTREAVNVSLLNRNQWIGYPGAPVTQSLLLHSPLFNNSIGAGLNIINDKIGPFRNTGMYLNLAYRLRVSPSSHLSFGVKAGGDLVKIDLASLYTTQANDPSFATSVSTGLLPNFGTGVYYYSDRFYLGVSVPRALRNKFWEIKNQTDTIVSRQHMHYYFIGGCVLPVTDQVKFRPSFQTKFTTGAPLQVDINASFIFHDKFYAGVFYRFRDAVGFIVQMNFTDQLRAALAWDQTVSGLSRYNNGSLEVSVSYDFKLSKSHIKSPRYF